MKTVLMYLICFVSYLNIQAQVTLPEFTDKPGYYDNQSKKIVDLEKSQYNTTAKAKGLFSAEAGFFLKGTTSPVKIPNQNTIKFIVKVNPGVDPTSIFDLVQFEVKNEQRIFITSRSKVTSTSNSFEKINYTLEKIKDGYYFLIVKNIANGEYFLGSNDFMYAFSVE